MNAEELAVLGLTTASNKLKEKEAMKKKMLIAYEHYRFVTPGIFERFEAALKEKTMKPHQYGGYSYDRLSFIKLSDYPEIPPQDVLCALKEAIDRQCFDTFEVAKVETVEVRPDPIIFGCINGCVDKFFISQWDNDVKIEDILKDNEG